MFRNLAIAFLILTGAAILFISVIYILPPPVYDTGSPEIKPEFSQSRMAEGKRIAQTICIRCHYNERTNTLSGRIHANPRRLGDFGSGNITQDSSTGIGTWSDGQLYYFLKTGIKPDGNFVFDMPKYPNLSEEDLKSIIVFLMSDDPLVKKTYAPKQPVNYSLLTKLLLRTILRPSAYDDERLPPPDTDNLIIFGRYLATAKFSCHGCHSLNMVSTNYNHPEQSWRFFKGGNPQVNEERERIYTPDISGDTIAGIGKWTKEEFIRAVRNGIKPDGTKVRDPMFPFYSLTDKEVSAIYAYLKSIP